MKKILIIRRDNIGDLICTTPLFQAIRKKYPTAYIAVLVNSYNAPAVEGNPYLDATFVYTKAKHSAETPVWRSHLQRLQLIWRLRRMNFDYVILASGGFAGRALKFARLLAPHNIVGFVTAQSSSPAITHAIPAGTHDQRHETAEMFRLLAPLGIEGEIPGLTLMENAAIASRIHAELPPAVANGSGPLLALHISARKERQRWPIEHFAELAMQLHDLHDARFLLFWSPGDEDNAFHPGDNRKAARLLELMAGLRVAPVPTGHLRELIAGLSLCDMAILSDGGAMHVAAALGKKIVCFFGNSSIVRWHPWGVPYQLLQAPTHDVSDISVESAIQASRLLISSQVSPSRDL